MGVTDRRKLLAARRRAIEEVLLQYDLIKWKGNEAVTVKSNNFSYLVRYHLYGFDPFIASHR